MLKRIARLLVTLLGISLGIGLAAAAQQALVAFSILQSENPSWPLVSTILYVSGGVVGFLLSVIFAGPVMRAFRRMFRRMELWAQSTPPGDVLFGSVGVVLGLTIAYLITTLFRDLMPWFGVPISAIVFVVLGYAGGYVGAKRWRDLPIRSDVLRRPGVSAAEGAFAMSAGKLLDTSAIIDGRICDIASTGFLDGPLILPTFVLRELQHIADSPDALRRKRARRALDMLQKMRKEEGVDLRMDERDFPEETEVDDKLIRLAQSAGMKIITNDYNLNKVAGVSGVSVLNINELSNAIKAVFLPGEELVVGIVREGKEPGQGVGYLDDGTMIVVDGAGRSVGQSVRAVVTSVLQTAAGRMMFGRVAE